MEYLTFEGVIPKGEYGGGTMIVWDQGRWLPDGDPRKGYAKGHLDFTLEGERLKGRWHLVRMRPRPREKTEQWLLLKGGDEFARDAGQPEITAEETTSVLSGRTNHETCGLRGRPGGSCQARKSHRKSSRTSSERGEDQGSQEGHPSCLRRSRTCDPGGRGAEWSGLAPREENCKSLCNK
jgi:bifunctional non-homologous end joining protein LigD